VRLCRGVDVGKEGARLDPGRLGIGIDRHTLHGREIEHEPTLADSVAGDVVAAALDAVSSLCSAAKATAFSTSALLRQRTIDAGVAVDHRVPDDARLVVAGIAGRQQHFPVEAAAQGIERTVADGALAGVEGLQGQAGHGFSSADEDDDDTWQRRASRGIGQIA
jgi:hypothetical protein